MEDTIIETVTDETVVEEATQEVVAEVVTEEGAVVVEEVAVEEQA